MEFLSEIIRFFLYCGAIVLISKYILATSIRKLANILKLKAKTVGNLAGLATSVPELLTVAASSITGLIAASMYNVLSSNVINTLQYTVSIFLNKNQKFLNNPILKVDLLLVAATIILPIIFIKLNLEINLTVVIVFIVLYILFKYIDANAHKLYLTVKQANSKVEKYAKKWSKCIVYITYLILSSILLFVIADLLGETIENLCYRFNIPEVIIGILLGIITSIPELITFFESQKHHKETENHEEGVIEATNNLFTSNILNLFIIQSIGVLIYIFFA